MEETHYTSIMAARYLRLRYPYIRVGLVGGNWKYSADFETRFLISDG
jgi:hypothetical protein